MAIWCGFVVLYGNRTCCCCFYSCTLFKADRVRWWWSVCTFVISFICTTQRNWNSFIHSFMLCLNHLNLKEKKMKEEHKKDILVHRTKHTLGLKHGICGGGAWYLVHFLSVLVDRIWKCWIIEIKINGFLKCEENKYILNNCTYISSRRQNTE